MLKIDFAAVETAIVAVVDAAATRVPLGGVTECLIEKGLKLGEEPETTVRAVCLASDLVDLRAGRAGGVGRREWFKGSKSAAEPNSPVAKLAKRLREEHGSALPKGEEREAATRAANAYFDALASGECQPMPLAEVLKKFGGNG